MTIEETRERWLAQEDLRALVSGLDLAAGRRLVSVVLYGSAARREDWVPATSDLNVLILLDAIDAEILEAIARPISGFRSRGGAWPRILAPELLHGSRDVFPIELLDISDFHVVLHGAGPGDLSKVDHEHLRMQCEREIREKLMRLHEAYCEVHDRPDDLARLIATAASTFAAIFRGFLRLRGGAVPDRNTDVFESFCAFAGLDPAPFRAAERVRAGQAVPGDGRALFASLHSEILRALRAVDRFRTHD